MKIKYLIYFKIFFPKILHYIVKVHIHTCVESAFALDILLKCEGLRPKTIDF